jgi:hypothetical protein
LFANHAFKLTMSRNHAVTYSLTIQSATTDCIDRHASAKQRRNIQGFFPCLGIDQRGIYYSGSSIRKKGTRREECELQLQLIKGEYIYQMSDVQFKVHQHAWLIHATQDRNIYTYFWHRRAKGD